MQIDSSLIFILILILVLLLFLVVVTLGILFYRQLRHIRFLSTQLARHSNQTTSLQTPAPRIQAGKIIISDSLNSTLYEIESVRKVESDYEETRLNRRQLTALNVLFPAAPSLAQNGILLTSNLYKLNFPAEAAQKIADGSWSIMSAADEGVRAIAVDGKNVIQAHGSLHQLTRLRTIAIGVVVWQALAIVTAQKFLSDINRRLARIDKKLGKIQDFLESQQYSRLRSNLSYVQNIANMLNNPDLEMSEGWVYLSQFESIERECMQDMHHLRMQMKKVYQSFQGQPLEAFFNAGENLKAAQELAIDYEEKLDAYLVAASIRGLAAQTRCAISPSYSLSLERLSAIKDDFSAREEDVRGFYDLVKKRLPELTDLFDGENEKKKKLAKTIGDSQERLQPKITGTKKFLSHVEGAIQQQIQAISQPVSLYIEVDKDGQVTKVWREKLGIPEDDFDENFEFEREEPKLFYCPECNLPFKSPQLVQEHQRRLH